MAGFRLNINLEGYYKERYWFGWWFDRGCLYEHKFDTKCNLCQKGSWYYTSPKKTGMKFGEKLSDHELYTEGRVYMYSAKKLIKKGSKKKEDTEKENGN